MSSTHSSSKKNPLHNGTVISVEPMRHLTEAIRPDDDWTGLTARNERKKRQNRLNQRAYRRRREAEAALSKTSSSSSRRASIASSQSSQNSKSKKFEHSPIELFSITSQKEYRFPLSTDHLVLLVQYNLYRACLSNMETLNITHPHLLTITLPQPNTPPSFEPTYLQRSIMHPAWIDSIPSATIRDNFIGAFGTYDPDEFWWDTVGDLHEAYEKPLYDDGTGESAKTFKLGDSFSGLMCWSDPWLIESYEVSPAHLKKWWVLHKGCPEIIHGTNKWREKRGEPPVVLEELLSELDIDG